MDDEIRKVKKLDLQASVWLTAERIRNIHRGGAEGAEGAEGRELILNSANSVSLW